MDAHVALDKAFTALVPQSFRIVGCGITGVEATLGIRGDRNTPGGIVVLRANQALAAKIAAARQWQFPDEVVDAIGTMARAVLPLVRQGHLFFGSSEPLMVGLSDYMAVTRSGVMLDEGWYTVPRPGALDHWQLFSEANGRTMTERDLQLLFQQMDDYSLILNFGSTTFPPKFVHFNVDNPKHTAWIEFMILPDRPLAEISDTELAQCIMVTNPGWSFMASQEPGTLEHLVAMYRELLPALGPLKP